MSFDSPSILILLFSLIPLFFLMLLRKTRRLRGVDFLAAPTAPEHRDTLKKRLLFRIRLSDFFFILFAGFTIVALSGPSWGTELTIETRRGLDMILAFDISQSMNVRDCPPLHASNTENSSRLEQALAIAKELTLRLEDVRLGTAAGKGRGVLMVPLTYDSEAVLNFIESLDTSFLSGTGTNLESLIDAGLSAFTDNMNRQQGIILFSDGEALQGSLEPALNRARNRGIAISAVGLGSERGGFVPVELSPASPEGLLLASDGSPVISSRQEEVLKNAAQKTSGIYVDGGWNNAVNLLADYFRFLSSESTGGFHRKAVPRWQIFVLAALASLGLSRLLGFRRRKTSFAAALCVFLLLFSSCSRMQGHLLIMEGNFHNSRHRYTAAIASFLQAQIYGDAAPYAEYGLGLSYSALEEKDAALERYFSAVESLDNAKGEHRELVYRVNYNTGIIRFEQGDYAGAADSFRRALEIDGSRLEAKRNLELSLLALSRPNQSEPDSSPANTGTDGQGSSALFDYLRAKEKEQWKSREWTPDSGPSGPDY